MPKGSPTVYTVENLRNLLKSHEDALAEIKTQIEIAAEAQVPEFTVKSGSAELKRGLRGMRIFHTNLRDGIHNVREAKGDFGTAVEPGVNGAEKPKAKRRRKLPDSQPNTRLPNSDPAK